MTLAETLQNIISKVHTLEDSPGRKEHCIWILFTALRSCDYHSKDEDSEIPNNNRYKELLKHYTTARLRHIMFGESLLCAETNPNPLDADAREERDELLKDAPSHFRHHWYDAIHIIREVYNYDLDREQKIKEEELA